MNTLLKPTHLLQLNNETWLMNERKHSNVMVIHTSLTTINMLHLSFVVKNLICRRTIIQIN